jgi:cold shock protein
MPRGTVKWFHEEKGYGFITPEDGGEDLFVHYTGIAGSGFKSLEEGAKVTYEETRGSHPFLVNPEHQREEVLLCRGVLKRSCVDRLVTRISV